MNQNKIILSLLLCLGLINGVSARLASSIMEDGANGALQLFGISPFEILIGYIACRLIFESEIIISNKILLSLSIPYLLSLLFPSSLASFLSLFFYSLSLSFFINREARLPIRLFTGLSFCAIWWAVGEKSFGTFILDFDAYTASGFLSIFESGIIRMANVIATPYNHSVVILVGCSTFYGLPLSLLSVWALTKFNRVKDNFLIFRYTLLLTMIYFSLNTVRIAFLCISREMYELGHSVWGLSAFDTMITVLTIAIAFRVSNLDGKKNVKI